MPRCAAPDGLRSAPPPTSVGVGGALARFGMRAGMGPGLRRLWVTRLCAVWRAAGLPYPAGVGYARAWASKRNYTATRACCTVNGTPGAEGVMSISTKPRNSTKVLSQCPQGIQACPVTVPTQYHLSKQAGETPKLGDFLSNGLLRPK